MVVIGLLVREDPFLLLEGQAALVSGETHKSMASPEDLGHAILGFPSCPSTAGSDPHGLGDAMRREGCFCQAASRTRFTPARLFPMLPQPSSCGQANKSLACVIISLKMLILTGCLPAWSLTYS